METRVLSKLKKKNYFDDVVLQILTNIIFWVIVRVGQAWRIVVGINIGTKVHMMYFNRYILPMLGG